MAANLVIVESPAKANTIEKYLGKEFKVLASYGHVRDLIPKDGAVDPDNNFAMKYAAIEKSAKHVDTIAKALKKADTIYLATDPDREGEAISWHLYELLKEKKALKEKTIYRIVFHEITRSAVQAAVANPRDILMSLVDAQQARRALDYLVGFKLSPLLWKKIRRGLSAGRVQSPALRMIVEREEEIEKFIKQEYWSILADTQSNPTKEQKCQAFTAKLVEYQGEKCQQFSVTNEEQSGAVVENLLKAAQGKLHVSKITKKQRKRNPAPPFITSTLQQEAARKLGFTAQRTMRTAQQLYEAGLISYMRTDSVNLSQDALEDIRKLIAKRYGKENLPEQPCLYKTKSKSAQEAHEAIRPTAASSLPESIKKDLSIEQFKLYDLIWKRSIACQMIHATLNTVSVDLSCGEKNRFRASGSTIANPGFMTVYQEGHDDINKEDTDEIMLPMLKEGELLDLLAIRGEQHFTEPPPRYTEASLVKALEEHGIGRPSTYASIISTLQTREYVILETKRFRPTDVGRIVNRFLTQYFTQYVDYDFTAKLEDELDAIARGEEKWIPILEKFWLGFKKLIGQVETDVDRKDVTHEAIDEACPDCGKPLSIRLGRNGRFIGCTTYPECKYTRNLTDDASAAPVEVEGRSCPECQAGLVIKQGRFGKFIGCSAYPACKHIEPLEKPADTGVVCPECKQGNLLKRKSRRGAFFFSCAHYPKCKYAVWNEPIKEPCPLCAWPILTIKITKRHGKQKVCPQKDCSFAESMEEET